MCEVTPREVLEAFVSEYRTELAAEEAHRKAAAETTKTNPKPPANRPRTGSKRDNRAERCRAYLDTLPASIEGQEGSKRVYHAARVVWNDFGIDGEEGYSLLEYYNTRSSPRWEEGGKQGLRRKWNEAVEKGPGPEGRGFRLEQDRPDWKPSTPSRTPLKIHSGGSDRAGDPPSPGEPNSGGSGLPEIVFNNRQYRDVEAEALAAIIRANDPPKLFVGNGCGLVDVQRSVADAPLAARELDGPAMRPVFARVADWKRVNDDGDLIDDYPPSALLSSFPAKGEWPGIPHLRGVVTYPVFGPGWQLHATPGYHPESGLLLDLGDLAVPAVADVPTAEDVAKAKELILTELLGDFPFVDQPSRANAVAMFLLPVVRHAIDGPTPLAMIDAPAEGTGKSLLAEVVTLTTIGEIPEAISPDMPDDEWNKFLLAALIEGQPVVYLDNANRKLDSGSLASALTARWKRGRILGETRIARARVNVCWIITGNNFECSREIARRCTWTRIDRGVENPSAEPVEYRHPDLLAWVRENRPRLLWSILTLVNNWISKGKPAGKTTLGKFEAWANALGGVLEAAGIDGLLGNADEFRKLCANQANEMPEFVKAWWERHASTAVITGDLFDMAKETLESVLTAESEDGRKKQLGRFMKKQRDRVYAGYRIELAVKEDGSTSTDYAGRPRYRLKPIKGKAPAEKPPAPTTPDEYAEGDDSLFDMSE